MNGSNNGFLLHGYLPRIIMKKNLEHSICRNSDEKNMIGKTTTIVLSLYISPVDPMQRETTCVPISEPTLSIMGIVVPNPAWFGRRTDFMMCSKSKIERKR